MNTQEFLSILENNQTKSLLFEYAPNKLVGANYHITEVKHTRIDSVDCGGKTDAWNETIIQLWESPKELGKRDYMKVDKAFTILNRVRKMREYNDEAEVKIEYSNTSFNMAQLYINNIEIHDSNVVVKLRIEKTQCKALDICGIPKTITAKISNELSCSLESGCC